MRILADYLTGEYRAESTDIGSPDINAVDLAKRRYTSIVDLEIVKNLSHVADVRKSLTLTWTMNSLLESQEAGSMSHEHMDYS
jgi:hypothetical protein